MKITKNHPLHYFIKENTSDTFFEADLHCYLEIPQTYETSKFRQVEDIMIGISTDMENYECCSFQIHFGKDTCVHSSWNNIKELTEQESKEAPIYGFKKVNKETYMELRERVFKIYLNNPLTDYSKLAIDSDI